MSYLITADPAAIGQAIEQAAEDVIKFMVSRAWQNLTIEPSEGGTPRRSGLASASWIVSIGTPYGGVAGSKESVDYSLGASGIEALRSYKLSQGAVYLANNTAYIGMLNRGWSKQARPEFIDAAYQRAVNATEQKFNLL